ncbi:unnamed protein product [Malus baccata var. baccata]
MAAEAVLTFATEGILKKVLSLAAQPFSLAWGFKAELGKLQESFTNIELLLNDVADKPQVRPIEAWVKKLKDVAHDAEDVFDELEYEGYRRKVEIQNHMKKKVLNFFSLSNPLAFRLQMAHKIQKINASLVDLERKASPLRLASKNKVATAQGIRWDRQTNAFFGKDEITVGRKDDVSKIVTTLTDSKYNQENLAVMAIVGMGGLGKTTLAKSVYNEDSIHKLFEKKIWICVSDTFDINFILHQMIEQLNREKAPSEDNQNTLLLSLNEELKDKKYLLVLDDVWNKDSKLWESFMECLSKLSSAKGSKIIVTTREEKVASISEKLLPRHELGKLSGDECWSIMKNRAFPNSSDPKFDTIGREIAEKCRGVPLMAKAYMVGPQICLVQFKRERSAGKLRTLFSNDGEIPINILPRFKALRVLNLSNAYIKEFPTSIGRLKHLRYLDISQTRFKTLPKSIGKLYNLQTLRATECALEEFPKELQNLINLRHIYFDKNIKFPQGIGRLTYLRTLPYFSVGNEIGRRIKELAGLNQLRGELIICDLEHVENGEEAEKAKLEEKTKVRHLRFKWRKDRSTTDNNEEEGVLEGLRPHLELESLSIENFMGNKFPPWMMSGSLLNNLKKIKLLGCHKCEGVPPLSLWASLQNLSIENCNGLSGPCNNLTSIEIKGSGSLTASLQKLTINLRTMTSLLHLSIMNCERLESWVSSLQFPLSLETLVIQDIPNLKILPSLDSLNSLSDLRIELWIWDCKNLMNLPSVQAMQRLTNLQSLRIYGCHPLLEERCSRGNGTEWPKISHIPYFRSCGNSLKRVEASTGYRVYIRGKCPIRDIDKKSVERSTNPKLIKFAIGRFGEELNSIPDVQASSLDHDITHESLRGGFTFMELTMPQRWQIMLLKIWTGLQTADEGGVGGSEGDEVEDCVLGAGVLEDEEAADVAVYVDCLRTANHVAVV